MKNLSTIPRMKRMCVGVLLLVMGFTFSKSAAQCVTPPSGLVSWWPGEGNASDIQDGNDGTLQNGTTFTPGMVGQAFSFDGVDDVITVPVSTNLGVTSAYTFGAWVNSIGSADLDRLIAARGDASAHDLDIKINRPLVGNTLQIVHNRTNGATTEAVLFAAPPLNQLFHLAVTFDGAKVRACYNGVEAALVSATNTIAAPLYTNRGWLFGRTTHPDYGGLGRFVGILDEIEIYSRALTASEIQSIYNAGAAGKCKECTPPELSITGDDPVCPNSTHAYTATTNATNPGFNWTVTGGTINGSNTGSSVSVTAGGAGTMAVSVEVTDGATNCSNSATQNVTVEDTEAPVIGTITAPMDPNQVNTLINASAGFTDACDANDHTAEWSWGDGNTSVGTVDQTTNTVSGSHTYTTAGVYTLTLTVTDGAGNADTEVFQFVVIYDPNAGYVTGGGWIESPPGAYPANPALTGKAHFGFVSRYYQGKSTPDGNTQFDFKVADLKFKSSSYDWLVVSGPHAKYKGSGTINDISDCGFMLFATDGQVSGGGGVDQFRIKIWQKDANETVVYDNQMGDSDDGDATDAAEGGNINIHGDGVTKAAQEGLASEIIPESYALEQNYPNPFNPSTIIAFSVKEPGVVQLSIYNLHGQEIRTLVHGQMNAGFHSVNWDGKDERGQIVPSGVYLYKLRVNGFAQTRKMIFMK